MRIMISVGVRDLKNQLSQYLQYVKRGERVLITEHNKVIAEISLPKESNTTPDVEELLEAMAISGKLQKAKRNRSVAASTANPSSLDWVSVYRENRNEE
jgi:prevent-host-death family protein